MSLGICIYKQQYAYSISNFVVSKVLLQIAHANFTVVFLLIQLQPLLEMQMRNTSLPLHQMIFSRKHLHRLSRMAERRAGTNRLTDSCALLTNIRLSSF